MGHWDTSTMGSDGAWDAIRSYVSIDDTNEIREALDEAFAPPPGDREDYDEGEVPFVLAIAELVAAAHGAPHPQLQNKPLRWAKRHAWSLSAYREAVRRAAPSPCHPQWVHPEGAQEFAAAIADLIAHLQSGSAPR